LKKSLTIIMVIGVVGILLMMLMMQSFMSRMTGADILPGVRDDLAARHAEVLADPDGLTVAHRQSEDPENRKRWILIEFRPIEPLGKSLGSLHRRMRMMARQVYSDPAIEKRYHHVVLRAETGREIVEIRVTREDARAASRIPETSGPRRR